MNPASLNLPGDILLAFVLVLAAAPVVLIHLAVRQARKALARMERTRMIRCELCGTTANVLTLKNGGRVCVDCREALAIAATRSFFGMAYYWWFKFKSKGREWQNCKW